MATLYENYVVGDNHDIDAHDDTWMAQTFTIQAGETHDLTLVKILVYRAGTPGTITVSIRAVDGSNQPTGADLATATFDGDALTTNTAGEWKEVPITGVRLEEGTMYALQIKALDGDIFGNAVHVREDTTGAYAGGQVEYSTDAGASWAALAARDFMFEEWGNPPPTSVGGFNPALAELLL